MGGHGGLNILPQKRWNVYNFDNRERVRKDEEEAARQQAQEQQQERARETVARVDKLRSNARSRGGGKNSGNPTNSSPGDEEEAAQQQQEQPEARLDKLRSNSRSRGGGKNSDSATNSSQVAVEEAPEEPKTLGTHDQLLDLFREENGGDQKRKCHDKLKYLEKQREPKRQRKDEKEPQPEDEIYRLAYGTHPDSRPWYMSSKGYYEENTPKASVRSSAGKQKKKTVEELRAERLKREEDEKARARKLLRERQSEPSSSARKRYNAGFGNARRFD